MLKPTVHTVMTVVVGVMLTVVLAAQAEAQQLPARTFSPGGFGLELIWKKSLGSGYSRIAVADGRAITMFSDGEFDNLVALDAATGQEIWRYEIAATYVGHGGSDSGPSSTPIVDGSVVYGLGPKGELFAVSVADGTPIWTRKIDDELGAREPFWGFTTTPVVEGELLIVQTGGPDRSSVSAFDKRTGELFWSLGDDPVSYQSPKVMTLLGRRQVVAVGNTQMMGIVPSTGEILWTHSHSTSQIEGSSQLVPVADDKFLLTPSSSGSGWQRDGTLYQVHEVNGRFAVVELWQSNAIKNSYAVPVLYENYLYGFSGGFLTCVDPATGEEVWKSRPPRGWDLLRVDGSLVIFAPNGDVVAVEATPEGYREQARVHLSDTGSFSAPSVGGGRIFVRNHADIAAIGAAAMPAAALEEPEPALSDSEFAAFVRRVEASDDKTALIDEFMSSHEAFPVIEGDTLAHFVYRGDAEDVAVIGPMADLFAPAALERIPDTDFFYKSYAFGPNGRWEYLFNIDFEQYIPDPLNPRRAPGFGESSEVAMPGWTEPKHLDDPAAVRGTIERFTFKSEMLSNEREVRVYLPAGYEGGQQRYPLLIVNNGIRAINLGMMDRTLDNLLGTSVAPIIVAFVGSLPIPDVYNESGFEYTRMLVKELVPHLDENFRTIRQADARAIMGAFFAAQVSLYAALLHPDTFSKVAAQSVRLGPPVGDELLSLIRDREKQPVEFYVDWNRHELRDTFYGMDLGKSSRQVAAALDEKGYAVLGGEAPGGGGWGSMRARTDRILEAFFPLRPRN